MGGRGQDQQTATLPFCSYELNLWWLPTKLAHALFLNAMDSMGDPYNAQLPPVPALPRLATHKQPSQRRIQSSCSMILGCFKVMSIKPFCRTLKKEPIFFASARRTARIEMQSSTVWERKATYFDSITNQQMLQKTACFLPFQVNRCNTEYYSLEPKNHEQPLRKGAVAYAFTIAASLQEKERKKAIRKKVNQVCRSLVCHPSLDSDPYKPSRENTWLCCQIRFSVWAWAGEILVQSLLCATGRACS